MMELQDTIAIPFQRWTKLRQRTAVQIYHNPIQCRLYTPPSVAVQKKVSKERDTTLELLGLDDDNDDDNNIHEGNERGTTKRIDQRFIPTRPSHRLHQDFYATYQYRDGSSDKAMKSRPISIFTVSASSTCTTAPSSTYTSTESVSLPTQTKDYDISATMTKRPKVQVDGVSITPRDANFTTIRHPTVDDDVYDSTTAAMLQQESMLLQMKTNNDLDSVQQMEQTMMHITTLLSQFTNLVAEQQDHIHTIYDTTTVTKDNLQKGTEHLHEAKVRVQSSKHYMATIISGMGIILLLFHWLRP
jgi:hypothetical protein